VNREAKLAYGTAAVVIVGLSLLAAPAVVSAVNEFSAIADNHTPAAASPVPVGPEFTETVAGEPAAAEDEADDDEGWGRFNCDHTTHIDSSTVAHGDLIDNGPTEGATGTVIHGDDGAIHAYEVAPGDSMIAIGDRFCVFHVHLFYANDLHLVGGAQPQIGQVLILDAGADQRAQAESPTP
jgi:hypothetical protein